MPHESTKSLEEKLVIVLEGMKDVNVSELCRRHGISQTSYYKWRDKFLDGGKAALANGTTAHPAAEADKARTAELERVIGRQAVEIQVLKKNLKLL